MFQLNGNKDWKKVTYESESKLCCLLKAKQWAREKYARPLRIENFKGNTLINELQLEAYCEGKLRIRV